MTDQKEFLYQFWHASAPIRLGSEWEQKKEAYLRKHGLLRYALWTTPRRLGKTWAVVDFMHTCMYGPQTPGICGYNMTSIRKSQMTRGEMGELFAYKPEGPPRQLRIETDSPKASTPASNDSTSYADLPDLIESFPVSRSSRPSKL
jgi:hypothetical protein